MGQDTQDRHLEQEPGTGHLGQDTWDRTTRTGQPWQQCCGAETICFRSSSDFQQVSAPAIAFELPVPVITDFILKSKFFTFFMKVYLPNSHVRSYSIWILIFIYYGTSAHPESTIFRLQPRVPAPCGSGSTTLHDRTAGTGRPGQDNQERTTETGYLGQDRQNRPVLLRNANIV